LSSGRGCRWTDSLRRTPPFVVRTIKDAALRHLDGPLDLVTRESAEARRRDSTRTVDSPTSSRISSFASSPWPPRPSALSPCGGLRR
jgi:hypothetical protein